MNDNELCHYGVVGMKWGVRRYQNYDGTLKEAGKQQYATSDTDKAARKQKAINTTKKVAAVAGVVALSTVAVESVKPGTVCAPE